MKLYFFLLTILLLSCQKTQKRTESVKDSTILVNDSVQVIGTATTEQPVEIFIDSLNVGRKTRNKVKLSQFVEDGSMYVQFKFFTRKNNQWVLKNDMKIEKNDIISFDPKISDFNNDGFNDVTFITGLAARGANEIRQLYIYDPKLDKLRFIKNSEDYPSFLYNSELDCIDAFLVYGGCMTVFLKIEADSLKEFASVELNNGLTVKTYDSFGNSETILEDSANEAGYIRYKNFKPLREYAEY